MTEFKKKFNPLTPPFDVYLDLDNPLQFKGSITLSSDFPTSAEVKNGWFYTITADVIDNDATKTNTGQSFKEDDEIAWNGTNWTVIGNLPSTTDELSEGLTNLYSQWEVVGNEIQLKTEKNIKLKKDKKIYYDF